MKAETLRLFQTLPHPCGYFEERTAQNIVLDPASPHLAKNYDLALANGYRRAGGHVYHPYCKHCRACIAARVPVAEFCPSRSQRRCQQRNRDLDLGLVKAHTGEEHFALYQHYLKSRHRDGGMDDPSPDDFERFLYTNWSPTQFLEFRLHGRLLAVAVTDFTPRGLSAVYTFFDPQSATRSLGTYAILSQIELARSHGLDHLYLGYWIKNHPKMHYKAQFRPLEILHEGQWQKNTD